MGNAQSQNKNRQPWITIALVDLPLKFVDATVICRKRFLDSDDVKLIIDGKVQKNPDSNWWGKNWLWQGRLMNGKTETKRVEPNLSKGVHYIELWSDEMPTLEKLSLGFGAENCGDDDEITDPIKVSDEFNPLYVLKDSAFVNNSSMNEEDIQAFLDSYHKVRDKNHISKIEFEGKKSAYWIKKTADENSVNPRLLLTKLQVEQQLINGEESINSSKDQLDSAMGVGVLDGGIVLEEFQGFATQLLNAARTFRSHFDRAKNDNFTHENIDGKSLTLLNASTYSLYKYTPHIEGAELVYKVYAGFFGTNDLGGPIQEDDKTLSFKKTAASISAILIIVLGSFFGFYKFNNQKNPSVAGAYSYKNAVELGDGLSLFSSLSISSGRDATWEDGLYCGFRFGKKYEYDTVLQLKKGNLLIDFVQLTNPELVMPYLSHEYTDWYNPVDVDSDGKKQEFMVAEYGNCNGNFVSFLRYNKDDKRIEKIPIVVDNQQETTETYVDIGSESLLISNGILEARYYWNAPREDKPTGFYRNYYSFDKEKNKLVWLKEEKE